VVVTAPQVRATRRPPPTSPMREIDEQSAVGEVYMRSLVRTQLRLALLVCAVFGLLLGGLPLLFRLLPGTRTVHVLGIPLPWLLLGVVVYPCFVLGGWLYVRAAERTERDFADLLERR
jgi:O-antigen/teichoic acid export membrane protein